MGQLTRSELRVKIMTILYQIQIYNKNKIEYNLDDIFKKVLEIDNDFVKDIVYGVITYNDKLETLANENLKDWTIDRLGFTDQAILKMGIYELVYVDTPDIVAINEAVELAKIYSDEKVKNMINAALDNIYHKKIGE
ncbi:MAG: transcription antitermination factor NusB [Clostridium sp.]|nr:transcription antitermination factor NusB [Clostridium sp.]MCM1443987.1 transcription antitermination factor NusB [Candidatus Amulumruptor caecigallinarius]